MSGRRVRRGAGALGAALVLALLTACVSLPESGPVRTGESVVEEQVGDAPYFAPPSPVAGSTPGQVAVGFVRAMEANPLTTAVARQYLTPEAARGWNPDSGTLVYTSMSVLTREEDVEVELRGVRRLDDRGAWLGGSPGDTEMLRLRVRQVEGEWRIADPPNALVVPDSYFRGRFDRAALYFFDASGQLLVPEVVYVPRGEQMATRLVRGLLEGPDPVTGSSLRSFLPAPASVDLSVPVDDGVAEVALDTGEASSQAGTDGSESDAVRRMAVQLSWTLRQVPGVRRVEVLVDGTPLTFPGGAGDVSVAVGADQDPAVVWASRSLFGVRDGRVVEVSDGREEKVSGPFGTTAGRWRSLGIELAGGQLALVTADGGSLLLGPVDARPGTDDSLPPPVWSGEDLLAPAWDHHGSWWTVDRAGGTATVVVGRPEKPAPVAVPGVTGEDVVAFVVSRDGTRLAAAVRGAAGRPDRVVVARLLRGARGRVLRATPARALDSVAEARLRGITDLGWTSPTTLAVLTAPTVGVSQVHVGPIDGSSGVGEESFVPRTFRSETRGLVTSPASGLPLLVDTADGRLYQLSTTGRWGVAETTEGLLLPTYVG
ncbi:MAG: LpqB family beta-propeller domain-containing protein [Nocardioides sp.]|nr:LpqB family beta-propeller domain-containing protein [Nocardioides sp.]